MGFDTSGESSHDTPVVVLAQITLTVPDSPTQTATFQDHNIVEKPYKGQPSLSGTNLRQNSRFEDLRLLNTINCTRDWVTQGDYLNNDVQLKFNRSRTPDHSATGAAISGRLQPDDQFNRSLLAKLPTNATIIGMMTSSTGSAEDFKIKTLPSSDQQKDDFNKSLAQVKNIYNQAIDCVQLTNNERNGFINANIGTSLTNGATANRGKSLEPGNSGTVDVTNNSSDRNLIFGVYCVRWSRSSSPNVIIESKFVISSIDVIDPPLNIYCYLETKMYVRVPVTLRITLKNPTRKILHLQAVLNSSDSFMFSGHKQLKVSIFAHSSYDLLFNLYPLKAGWQPLPELQLDYANPTSGSSSNKQPGTASGKSSTMPVQSVAVSNKMSNSSESTGSHPGETGEPSSESLETQLKAELNTLVKRWMPKMVFIHPPRRN